MERFFVPAGTPAEVIKKLSETVKLATQQPEVQNVWQRKVLNPSEILLRSLVLFAGTNRKMECTG